MKLRYLIYTTVAILGIVAYALLQDSVYPLGDDLGHLTRDRNFPKPAVGGWISNRVVDGFFTPFSFAFFELFYNAFPHFSGSRNFIDLFQLFNAATYATALAVLLTLLTRREISSSGLNKSSVLLALLAAFCALLYWLPFLSMTDLFAYTITAVITLSFVMTAYPLSDLMRRVDQRNETANRTTAATYAAFSLGAYLTAVGLEIFVVFAWLYIGLYHALLVHKRHRARGTIAETIRFFAARTAAPFSITLQFLAYSAWALYSMTTSGRYQQGIKGADTDFISNYTSLGLELLKNTFSGVQVLIVLVLCSLVILVLPMARRLLVRIRGGQYALGENPKAMLDWEAIAYVNAFGIALCIGYITALVALTELTNTAYYNLPKFLFPLNFVLLGCIFMMLPSLVRSFENTLANGLAAIAVFGLVAFVTARGIDAMDQRKDVEEKIRTAFEAAARAEGNLVAVPFKLPMFRGNNGYPWLPAEGAAGWYRESYRRTLNKYYGTEFDRRGPVFYTEGFPPQEQPGRKKN